MQVLNIFSWLPAKEISLEKLEQIFVEYHNGIYDYEYNISFEMPSGDEKDMLLQTRLWGTFIISGEDRGQR
jgi:hypothetical protein